MKTELKTKDSRRPILTVIRNPALLPAKRSRAEGSGWAVQKGKNEKAKMPGEPVGYIRCRKHDFL